MTGARGARRHIAAGLDEVWHVPNDPDTRTPPALLRLLGLWNPTLRPLWEMQDQFEETFVVDTKIIDRLGLRATPLERALGRR